MFVPRLAELDLEHREAAFFDLALFEVLLRFAGEPIAKHVLLAHELVHQWLPFVVLMGRNRGRPANNERGARFIDQDGIDFVDDRVIVAALDLLFARRRHAVVAQVIEAELAVRSVGDIHPVLLTTFVRRLIVLDDCHGQPEETVKLPHPLGVAPGEVIVHRHQVRALSGKRVEIERQRRHQRLAFAGRHF